MSKAERPEFVDQVLAYIRENGVTQELEDLLNEAPRPRGFLAAYIDTHDWFVTERGPYDMVGWFTSPYFLNGYWVIPEGYQSDVRAAVPRAIRELGVAEYFKGRTRAVRDGETYSAQGPDGETYRLHVVWSTPRLPTHQLMRNYAIWAALAAWVLTGVWIGLDARARNARPAVAWLWLGVMGGPVALAVWLTARPPLDTHPHVCPGCGADTAPGTTYCVRCGDALYPTCPSCGRKVEFDWDYCGHCGKHLGDQAAHA